jgi:transposase
MSTAAPLPTTTAADAGTLPAAEHLPDDPAILKRMILELLATLQQERHDKDELRHRLDRLLRRLYGPKGERFDPQQPSLFDEATADSAADSASSPPAATEPSVRRCRPHGRRHLPANLPRRPVHHELAEAERACPGCGQTRVAIGVETSEQLDYQPASLFVVEHMVHKYACPSCSKKQEPAQVVAAAKPESPIAKGLPGAGLLAHLIVSKYADHLPLYRLERIYERQGIRLARSTTCDWLAACAKLLTPLYDILVSQVLQSRVIHTDDTPVTIQAPEPGATATGRMWIYLGDASHPYNVFAFTPNRQRDGPQQFLRNFHGYLQADAFAGYDALYLPDPLDGQARIVEVACNAHARRKFYEARTSDAGRAHQALAYYGQLYEIERRAKGADQAQRRQMRQDLAVPILAQFQAWLLAQRADVLPKSPLGEAIQYALNQWTALLRYTEAGCLAIDNNVAEREMKRIAIGRKNWLFVGTAATGQTAAVLFSFTSTCQRLGVEPWAYLCDVLTRMPTKPLAQLADLLPDRWQAARQPAATPGPEATPAADAAD